MTGVDDGPQVQPGLRRRRRWPVVLAVLALGVVALAAVGVLLAQTALKARAEAEALQAAVQQARTNAQQGSLTSLRADLQRVQSAAADLEETTASPRWVALGLVPGMGATTDAVDALAGAAGDVATAALPLASAIETAPSTLAIIESLPTLEPQMRTLNDAAQQATSALAALQTDDLRFGLDRQVPDAASAMQSISDGTASALEAWPALSGLLGFDGRRTYLVMLQNPAEARGSGGLFSAFMRLTLDRGVPTIDEAATRKSIDDTRIPLPKDIDPGEQQMWGDYLTKWASFNTSPDFPTTAKLARAGMKARGTPVDGVIAIDPFAVEAVLKGTGPVEHKGVTIDGGSAADFFTKDIYTDYPSFADVAAKDDLALGLLYATVDSALKRPLDVQALADAVPGTIADGHLQAWVPDEQEQAWLDQTGLAHDVATADPQTPILAFNNATGGKLDAYITKDVQYDKATCTIADGDLAGWTQSTFSVTLTNNALPALPDYVDLRLDDPTAPKGSTKVLVTVLGPEGAVEDNVTTQGETADYVSGQAHDRPYWLGQVELERGQTSDLTIAFVEAPTSEDAGVTKPCPSTVE